MPSSAQGVFTIVPVLYGFDLETKALLLPESPTTSSVFVGLDGTISTVARPTNSTTRASCSFEDGSALFFADTGNVVRSFQVGSTVVGTSTATPFTGDRRGATANKNTCVVYLLNSNKMAMSTDKGLTWTQLTLPTNRTTYTSVPYKDYTVSLNFTDGDMLVFDAI